MDSLCSNLFPSVGICVFNPCGLSSSLNSPPSKEQCFLWFMLICNSSRSVLKWGILENLSSVLIPLFSLLDMGHFALQSHSSN